MAYSGSNNQTYTVTASATSGLSVALTIDASSTSGCAILGTTVSYGVGFGTCIIDANQSGNTDYSAAPQAQQSFSVSQASQTVSITSTAPDGETYSGSDNQAYTVVASATSGLNVTLTIDGSSTSGCTISGTTVHYGSGVGTCIIDADQPGNANYSAAPQSQQSFSVSQATPITPTIDNLPSSGTYGGNFTATVATTGNGTTSVTSDSVSACTVGVDDLTVDYVGVGTCFLTASVAATTDYTATNGSTQTFSIGKATPTVSISNIPSSAPYGGNFTPIYAIAPVDDTGVISAISNSAHVCIINSSTVDYVGVGTCSLTASVAATTDYTATNGSTQTFPVSPLPLGSWSQNGSTTWELGFTNNNPLTASVTNATSDTSATCTGPLSTPCSSYLPSGLTFSSSLDNGTLTFMISGMDSAPSTKATYTVTFTATDSGVPSSLTILLYIEPAVSLSIG